MARKPRETSGTGIYHVMMRGINRQDIFSDEEDFRFFQKVLFQTVCPADEVTGRLMEERCTFYAYCLMSNHVHLLVRQRTESLGQIVKRIAVSYAQYYNKKYLRYGHLFQDRFRSEPVNTDTYFFTLMQYIHQNPVAAGITDQVGRYPWDSWGEYERSGAGVGEICSTAQVLRRMPLDDLRALVFTPLPRTQSILDYDSGNSYQTDDDVKAYLTERYGLRTPADIQLLSRERQEDILRDVKQQGATLRQLVRLTGLTLHAVRRA
ncbi:MAG: transposase [Bacteroidales bacterium]|nr:transposase [Bacteroidales bacterium]